MKVNLGCGRTPLEGWLNVDHAKNDGVNIVLDLDRPDEWRFEFDGVSHWRAEHVLEHIRHPLPLFEAMWHASEPGAQAWFACPYGSSNDAFDDPTHVRPLFHGSWMYYEQPAFWRADYGYRGDWQLAQVELMVPAALLDAFPGEDDALNYINTARNTVREQRATLTAVKPAREPDPGLRTVPNIVLIGER